MKNVIAIASGISDGLGLGSNARAALITRGLKEISVLGSGNGRERGHFLRPLRIGRPCAYLHGASFEKLYVRPCDRPRP